jgi:hypothetical protein
VRVGQRDRDLVVEFLEPESDPGERAAGADRAGEAVDPAVHLLPDLGRSASMCALRLAMLSNWLAQTAPSVSSARRREVWTKWPGLENLVGGTRTSSAPSARSVSIFSFDWFSGMTMIVL